MRYAYALYARGLAHEGWKVLECLFHQSMDFSKSRILPGIPEYFDGRGRGMYPYLTGSASWFLLTMQTQVFGICGKMGDLSIAPKLTAELFRAGAAEIECTAAGRRIHVRFLNPDALDWGEYQVTSVTCKDKTWNGQGLAAVIPREELPEDPVLSFTVELGRKENENV